MLQLFCDYTLPDIWYVAPFRIVKWRSPYMPAVYPDDFRNSLCKTENDLPAKLLSLVHLYNEL